SEILRIFEDSKGSIWCSAGVVRREGLGFRITRIDESTGYTGSPPSAFVEDRAGDVWVGGYAGSVARFREGKFRLFPAPAKLPSGQGHDVLVDSSGRLWIATLGAGLVRVEDPTIEDPTFEVLNKASGLASDLVACVVEDPWGRIFAG